MAALRLRSVALLTLCICSSVGCQMQRPYGYYKVWADHHSLGAPAVFIERVRTDDCPTAGRIVRGYSHCDDSCIETVNPSIDGLHEDPEVIIEPTSATESISLSKRHPEPKTWLFQH